MLVLRTVNFHANTTTQPLPFTPTPLRSSGLSFSLLTWSSFPHLSQPSLSSPECSFPTTRIWLKFVKASSSLQHQDQIPSCVLHTRPSVICLLHFSASSLRLLFPPPCSSHTNYTVLWIWLLLNAYWLCKCFCLFFLSMILLYFPPHPPSKLQLIL